MKNKFLPYLFLCGAMALLFSACRKESFPGKETKQSGTTFVYINEAGGDPAIQYFDVFTDVKPVVLLTVRRDAASNADLQKAVTVTLTADPDSTNNSGLTPLTSNLYTFPTAADVASGGIYAGSGGVTANADGTVLTVNFAAGEFAKNIIFKVDGSKLDLSNTYGAVYKITNFGGFKGKVGYGEIAAGLAVKNGYDGKYSYNGTIVRTPAPGTTDATPQYGGTIADGHTIDVVTSGPTSDALPAIFWADGTTQIGGLSGLQLAVDPATNKVTVTAGNTYLKNIDGSDNSYDPATKTFHLNFAWTTGGPGTSGREVHVTLVYKGSR